VAQVTPEARDGLLASMMGLAVQGVGRQEKPPGHLYELRPRTLNAFAAVYLDGGRGVFESRPTGRREVRAGTLFVLFPGVEHLYGPREEESWREYWAIFDGFIPERYRRTGLLDPARPFFELGLDAALIRRWRECLYLAGSRRPQRAQELAEKFFALLGHVFGHARRPEGAAERWRGVVEEVIGLMEARLSEQNFPLERYAPRFYASYSALRARFREATGVSPARYFARMKMQAARARLLTTPDPVKSVAAGLGFDDPYHFSRRFKQLVGVSPENFRRAFAERGSGTRGE
jgi:AraC-like DNA-binding protein